jgi:hypothetical protein
MNAWLALAGTIAAFALPVVSQTAQFGDAVAGFVGPTRVPCDAQRYSLPSSVWNPTQTLSLTPQLSLIALNDTLFTWNVHYNPSAQPDTWTLSRISAAGGSSKAHVDWVFSYSSDLPWNLLFGTTPFFAPRLGLFFVVELEKHDSGALVSQLQADMEAVRIRTVSALNGCSSFGVLRAQTD